MSASLASRAAAVTPATVRRRIRERRVEARREHRLNAPLAHPRRLAPPVGRPLQPRSPGAGAPVSLRGHQVAAGTDGSIQLTDRGIAAVVALLAVITLATLAVAVVKFFGVSNAPLEHEALAQQPPVVAVLQG